MALGNSVRIRLRLLCGVALFALSPTVAAAQTSSASQQATPSVDAPSSQISPASADQEQTTEVDEIVVTGSFIRGSAENAALPVEVLGEAELANRGAPSVLDLIKALPSSSGALGDTNQFDSRSAQAEGSGSVNLRALGAERTLVLLNGRRLAFNPVPATSGGAVDTNLIPAGAIGRIEVLKDGAAALYGSDAIAGVVNFITRSNQDGFQGAVDYRYIDGSDGDWTGSLSWGGEVADWRLFISGGYQHRSRLGAYERDFVRKSYLENPNGGYTAIGNPGTYVPLGPTYTAIGTPRRDVNCEALNGFAGLSGTTPACYAQSVQFGNMVEEEDRYQIFGTAERDLGDKATIYVEGLYSHTNVPNALTGPSQAPVQMPSVEATGIPALAGRLYVPSSNPGFGSYVAANPGVFPAGTTGVQLAAYRPFFLGGNPLYSITGGNESERRFEAYRLTAGLKGDLTGTLRYDVSATYMEDEMYRTQGDVLINRLQLALIGLGGPGCDADPSAPGIQGTPGSGGCQYFNPFSTAVRENPAQGGVNPQYNSAVANDPALIGWFYRNYSATSKSRLFVVDAVLNGEMSIQLPGGAIGWAVGAQYRKTWYENGAEAIGDIDQTPCRATPDFFVTACDPQNGPFSFWNTTTSVSLSGDVYGVFAELSLPLFDTLSFQAAARFEDYGGGTGSTFNPKIAGKWSALPWLALRGSINTTFRGPPLIATDPNPSTTLQNVRGIYRAIDNYGDPDLKPERATAYNIGLLVDAGGFRGSVDYWGFSLRDTITTEPIGALASALYPTNTTNRCSDPAYAEIFSRFTFQDLNGNGVADDCAAANISRVRVNTINGAPIDTNGLDLSAAYIFDDVAGARVTIGGDATWTTKYDVGSTSLGELVLAPAFDAVGNLNFQTVAYPLPEWKGSVFVNLAAGPHNLRISGRYFDGYTDQRTDIFSPSVNYGVDGAPVTLSQGKEISSWTVVDVSYRARFDDGLDVYAAIDNLFDRDPPFVRLNYSYDPFTANGLGRTVKIGLSKTF